MSLLEKMEIPLKNGIDYGEQGDPYIVNGYGEALIMQEYNCFFRGKLIGTFKCEMNAPDSYKDNEAEKVLVNFIINFIFEKI